MAIVALILDIGIKISELNALNIEDYDRNFSYLYVQKREVKINTDTKEKLDQYIDQDRTVVLETDSRHFPLFVTSAGKRLAVRSIQSILKNILPWETVNRQFQRKDCGRYQRRDIIRRQEMFRDSKSGLE